MYVKNLKIAIIGLGYVGLPLAIEFAKKRAVIGFDINDKRIEELKSGLDKNLETSAEEIKNSKLLHLTSNKEDLQAANCYIITVPTPVDEYKKPDLKLLILASEIVSKYLKPKDIVIYESTVYPGCTEEICVPVIEKYSSLLYNQDFFCGYSPERINPGDKKHRLPNIKKITSGSTPKIADLIDELYKEIIIAGTFKAKSIKVAEAAKVIENTQRDLNIALINELSIIFKIMNIDTKSVLDAAESKWNFVPFRPGLVGGHCIGVDPYYLTYKAKSLGYNPEVILAGRRINDSMGAYVSLQLIKEMKRKSILVKEAKILIMGLTFKENCPDVRNSGVANIIKELNKHQCKLDLYDPWVGSADIKNIYNSNFVTTLNKNTYDAIIIAVAHDKFRNMGIKNISVLGKKNYVLFDLKNIFNTNESDFRF
jgi:UDP-N-acetyl-D-galactosamine dehydrogenase